MKRLLLTLAVTLACISAKAMSYERAREEALYLTDKMAYELNLNDQQYNDAYEINLDYLMSMNSEADLFGTYFAYRMSDFRHILYDWQYDMLLATEYFVRPLLWRTGGWYFPIYSYYNRGYFYFSHPHVYVSYRGGHRHDFYRHGHYYAGRRPEWRGGMRDGHRGHAGSFRPNAHGGSSRGEFHPNTRGGSGRGEFRPDAHGTSRGSVSGSTRGTISGSSRGGDFRPDAHGTSRGSVSGSTRGTISGSTRGGSYRPDASSTSRGNMFSGSSTRSTVGHSSRGSVGSSSTRSYGSSTHGSMHMGGSSTRGGSFSGSTRGGSSSFSRGSSGSMSHEHSGGTSRGGGRGGRR